MPSTYSTNLKIELPATGEQSGTWGVTANTNMGTLIEQAIVGVDTVSMADADTTITIANGASSTARNFILTLSGSLTATRTLTVPTIDKPYIVYNATTGGYAVTVKTAAGTGISVPNGQKRFVYADSTNVLEGLSSFGNVYANGYVDTTTAFTINSANLALRSSGYTILYDGSTRQNLFLGGTGDPTNYYRNTNHSWQSVSGTTTFLTASASYVEFGSPMRYGGVTLGSNVTGTGNLVLSASPTLTGTVSVAGAMTVTNNTGGAIEFGQSGSSNTPYFDWHSSASVTDYDFRMQVNGGTASPGQGTLTLTGATLSVQAATTLAQALTYGGVTLSNSVTGTGSMVLSTSPSFGGTVSYSSMTGTNLYTVNGVMQMTRDSSTGGGLLFIDSAAGGQNWQAGPGSGTGNKDYWGLYNFGTTTTVVNIGKTGDVNAATSFVAPYHNASAAYQFNGANLLLITGTYTVLYDGSARQNFLLGGTGDQKNYYRNAGHLFQTVSGATNIMEMAAGGTTFYQPINYGGVTLSNSVTGTGSMVLSAAPTFTGTVTFSGAISGTTAGFSGLVTGTQISLTTADSGIGAYIKGTTGMIRMYGYAGGYSVIDACNAAQSLYQPIRITGTTVALSSSGTDKLAATSSGVTFGSAAMDTPTGAAPLAMARAWVNWTGGGTTINSSMNVSSIIRVGTGQYIVSFSTAAPHATYATCATGGVQAGIFTSASPDSAAQTLVYSANTLSQTYQDTSPYSLVAYW